jgi:hypothetical protein
VAPTGGRDPRDLLDVVLRGAANDRHPRAAPLARLERT